MCIDITLLIVYISLSSGVEGAIKYVLVIWVGLNSFTDFKMTLA